MKSIENEPQITAPKNKPLHSSPNFERISDWFQVSGDLDDFIFYYEDEFYFSER